LEVEGGIVSNSLKGQKKAQRQNSMPEVHVSTCESLGVLCGALVYRYAEKDFEVAVREKSTKTA